MSINVEVIGQTIDDLKPLFHRQELVHLTSAVYNSATFGQWKPREVEGSGYGVVEFCVGEKKVKFIQPNDGEPFVTILDGDLNVQTIDSGLQRLHATDGYLAIVSEKPRDFPSLFRRKREVRLTVTHSGIVTRHESRRWR